MKKLEKIKLNSAKLLNDTEMKAVFGGSGPVAGFIFELKCLCPDGCPETHSCPEGTESGDALQGSYIKCGVVKTTCTDLCKAHPKPDDKETL